MREDTFSIKAIKEIAKSYRITSGADFHLKSIDCGDTGTFDKADKEAAEAVLAASVAYLEEQQDKLYAQDRWGLLLIFQAMDAAGKDGAIKHVMTGVNPAGCQVFSFKAPSAEELDHDFLWRCLKNLPERGRIGIFNRSYYEETLVVRVHPELLHKQKLPAALIGEHIWRERFEDISAFERYLDRNGMIVRKFFLHVSKKEQRQRFLKRLERPEKNWKFSAADVEERQHWEAYMQAYEDMIRHTATPHAPWYVIPADNKWFTRLAIASAVIETLDNLHLAYPVVDAKQREQLALAREALLASGEEE